MPPKGKQKASGGGDRLKDVNDTEEPLQAVILADSFETRFHPFTLSRPRCLLPLANTPLIEYTFEFLALSGVDEVFVYCGAHTDQVEEYINNSKWNSESSPFALNVIRSTSKSIGDAMRDLDKKEYFKGDFIVVYGDIVSNFPLGEALAKHRARKAKDKNAIMTMVLRAAGAGHRTKAQGNSPVFVLDPSNDRCLHYEQMSPVASHHAVEIDPELLASHQEIDVRHDLIDCGIDICTPDALALWSDNFDYEAPRRGFLHSVLKDYELNGKTIHTHILEEGHYAARVRNLHGYDSVSKDVLARWTWPMVPDSNFDAKATYGYAKGNVYLEEDVELALTCKIGRGTQVGAGTKIAENTTISSSVIGRNCRIGKNCVIKDSYIWDGAVIGDDTTITKAIVANHAVIGSKCTLEKGALLSYGVKVGDGRTISSRQRLLASRKAKEGVPAVSVNGVDGEAEDYLPSDEEDIDAAAGLAGALYKLPHLTLSSESISTLHSDAETDLTDASHASLRTRDQGASFLSTASDDSSAKPASTPAESAFHHDAVTSLHDALKEGTDVSTIQLELQALRMSTNASEHQVRRALVTALIRWCIESRRNNPPNRAVAVVKDILATNQMLIQRNIFDKDSADGLKPDQVDFLLLVQRDLAGRAEKGGEMNVGTESLMLAVCNELYLSDVLEQEGLEQWWEDERGQEGEGMEKIRVGMTKFMEVVLESEEEDSDEEDEDEDDDEDDDD